MNQPEATPDPPPSSPAARPLGPPQPIPVFNCRVLVSPRDAAGLVTARAAEVEGIACSAPSEREALQRVVQAFKALAADCVAQGRPIPWRQPPHPPAPGDQERFIAVHL